MLSIDQLTITAYQTNGGIICRKCGEAEGLPTKSALCAYSTGEFAGYDGLDCDHCGAEIEAPYSWTCPECDAEYFGGDARVAEESHDESGECGSVDCPGESEDE